MADIVVRQATLADTYAITDIYCSNVEGGVFTRRNSDGTRTPIPYEELSLFEHYMNGGAWMSVETCAVWLAHLLRYTEEIPLVVESNGVVLGEAEVTLGNEPAPYGKHLHVCTLKIHRDAENQEELTTALLGYIKEMAQVTRIQQVSVSISDSLFTDHDFKPIVARRLVLVPTKIGRVVYKATPISDFNAARIHGWFMPFGRYQNARHEWTRIWPGFWNCIPELVEPQVHHYEIELSGQKAIYILQQDRYRLERASVAVWTERPLSSHIVSAIRDRAAREGYSEVSLFADDKGLALVETESEPLQEPQVLYAWHVLA